MQDGRRVGSGFAGDHLIRTAFLVSILMHGLVLWILPGWRLMERVQESDWLVVDLLPPPEINPEPVAAAADGDAGNTGGDRLGDSPLFPSPPVWVPERMNAGEVESVAMKFTIPIDRLPERAGSGSGDPGDVLADYDRAVGTSFAPSGLRPPELPWQPSVQPVDTPEPLDGPEWRITGEVARRRVIFRPPLPRPAEALSGTVHIKFWVLPDGTIGKMVPIMRGDPELERVAMDYLEKWRFEAVESAAGLQSGSVPIRFTIRR